MIRSYIFLIFCCIISFDFSSGCAATSGTTPTVTCSSNYSSAVPYVNPTNDTNLKGSYTTSSTGNLTLVCADAADDPLYVVLNPEDYVLSTVTLGCLDGDYYYYPTTGESVLANNFQCSADSG